MNQELQFFIFKKKSLINLINKCTYIIETYESLLYADKYTDESKIYTYNIDFYTREKDQLQEKIQICDENINKLCDHEFLNYAVDVDFDTLSYIRKCCICEIIEKM